MLEDKKSLIEYLQTQISNCLNSDCKILGKINNLSLDSRKIDGNTAFVAIKGYIDDGRKYIKDAITNGAIAVIIENDGYENFITNEEIHNSKVPIILINNLSSKIGYLASEIYDFPSDNINVIGVTGTNGKTTVSSLIAQWIKIIYKEDVGVFGTIGNGIYPHLKKSNNTTSDAIYIQKELKSMVSKDINFVTMEVSSHGLDQNRVSSVRFKQAIFTNLSRDHLDYHHTFDEYFNAKKKLFVDYGINEAIINIDCPYGKKLSDELIANKSVNTICLVSSKQKNINSDCYVKVTNVKYHYCGQNIDLQYKYKGKEATCSLKVNLIGEFNTDNIVYSFASLLLSSVSCDILSKTSNLLEPISGRMECISNGKINVVIDYAHTNDALEKSIEAVKLHYTGKVWCIFGCGGERDRGKRPLMGKIASENCDYVIITNDNPRKESPKKIVNDILSGISNSSNIKVILERSDAIEYALYNAIAGDVILIAGKGHENEQVLSDRIVYVNDKEVVLNFWENFKC